MRSLKMMMLQARFQCLRDRDMAPPETSARTTDSGFRDWFRLAIVLALLLNLGLPCPVRAQQLTSEAVLEAMHLGQRYLTSQQRRDGTWSSEGLDKYSVGVTAFAALALLNSGMTANDPPVQRVLNYLRRLPENEPPNNYDVSVMIMVFTAAGEKIDLPRVAVWAERLEGAQTKIGDHTGGWGYSWANGGPDFQAHTDPSNTQFAVLALREAAVAGVNIDRQVWVRAQSYWRRAQNADGGWSYQGPRPNGNNLGNSTGSMTVAGLASLVICEQMLQTDEGVSPEGIPPCCDPKVPDEAIERAIRWLSHQFSVGYNPGNESNFLLYYLYGLERAGRLSGQRFFGAHDWYREGAEAMLLRQRREGLWMGVGHIEDRNFIVATSYALLFLSKGLSPILINKLKYGPRDAALPLEIVGQDWNLHGRDVRNLTELISTLDRWPKQLNSQDLDLPRAVESGGVSDLLQAPVLYISGSTAPVLNAAETQLLRSYLEQGGFIFATASCQSAEFEEGFRALLRSILPPGEGELRRLPADHPVYRAEYLLQPDGVELFGIDFGCRTSVIYCPEDLGCYWQSWTRYQPPTRNVQFQARILRATKIGVNVIAYATGREPPNKLNAPSEQAVDDKLDRIERGLLQVAKIRHEGAWDAAPRALRNLLIALNETVGVAASPKQRDLVLRDPNLFQYPLLYMHGRQQFQLSEEERRLLKLHLERGGMLFADACCGAAEFDRSFRELMEQLYPNQPLQRIPVKHELFSEEIGHPLQRVRRRVLAGFDPNAPLDSQVREVEPFLEGVEVDGRYVVIYSKYDISCALERQASVNCDGYLPEDAAKIAINIVLYAMLQELRLPPPMP